MSSKFVQLLESVRLGEYFWKAETDYNWNGQPAGKVYIGHIDPISSSGAAKFSAYNEEPADWRQKVVWRPRKQDVKLLDSREEGRSILLDSGSADQLTEEILEQMRKRKTVTSGI